MDPTNALDPERLRKIRLLVMDCDGVLTDGRLYFGAAGEELKVFDVHDGQGIVMWHEAGFKTGIISGRNSPIVDLRGGQLGIEYIRQGVDDKVAALNEIVDLASVSFNEVAFVGDDIPGVPAMASVGVGVAVADALETVKQAASYITRARGGRGAVRELIDLMLAAKV